MDLTGTWVRLLPARTPYEILAECEDPCRVWLGKRNNWGMIDWHRQQPFVANLAALEIDGI